MTSDKDIRYPLSPTIRLTLANQPAHNNFKRFLSFRNYRGQVKRLAVEFRKTSGLVWEPHSFPDGIDVLTSLAETNNRSYWDIMYLENLGGRTSLDIQHLLIEMHYEDLPSGTDTTIPIVDTTINQILGSGYSQIALEPFARLSRYRYAGLSFTEHEVVLAAARDLGKSGSDGRDQYAGNPKYRGDVKLLCSEFVSWYYHEAGLVVGGKNFRTITGTQQLHDIFKAAGQLYRYNNSRQAFLHRDTEELYLPRPGDFLERRADNKAEHSMIMLNWDDAAKEATVINGPWPVSKRLVRVQHEEIHRNRDYWLGRIEPI